MNYEYLFRAKHVHELSQNKHLDGKWIEGYLTGENHIYSPSLEGEFLIDTSTICQCCGYERIYEHDIFECDEERYEIVFDQDELAWFACGYGYGYRIQLAEFKPDEINVIGNSFDNPELLEEEE